MGGGLIKQCWAIKNLLKKPKNRHVTHWQIREERNIRNIFGYLIKKFPGGLLCLPSNIQTPHHPFYWRYFQACLLCIKGSPERSLGMCGRPHSALSFFSAGVEYTPYMVLAFLLLSHRILPYKISNPLFFPNWRVHLMPKFFSACYTLSTQNNYCLWW